MGDSKGKDEGSSSGKRAEHSKEQLYAMIKELQSRLGEERRLGEVQAQKGKFSVPTPERFDGSRNKLKNFLTQTELYIRFNRKAIPGTSDQVLAATTLLTGNAFTWVQPHVSAFLGKEWDQL